MASGNSCRASLKPSHAGYAYDEARTGRSNRDRVMRISLVRSGGVAGMRLEASVDTAALEPDKAERFHNLVEEADLPRLSEPTIKVKSEPDRFRYTLTVED